MANGNDNENLAPGGVIIPEEDALPNPTRTGHGKMPEDVDDDVYEAAAEQERVAAGLADYAPSDVPPATDPLPAEASEAADLAQRGLLDDNDATGTGDQENNKWSAAEEEGQGAWPCPSSSAAALLLRMVQPTKAMAARTRKPAWSAVVFGRNKRNHLCVPAGRYRPDELGELILQNLPGDLRIVRVRIDFRLPGRVEGRPAEICELDLKLPPVFGLAGPGDMP
jgi:hypothetical protein